MSRFSHCDGCIGDTFNARKEQSLLISVSNELVEVFELSDSYVLVRFVTPVGYLDCYRMSTLAELMRVLCAALISFSFIILPWGSSSMSAIFSKVGSSLFPAPPTTARSGLKELITCEFFDFRFETFLPVPRTPSNSKLRLL